MCGDNGDEIKVTTCIDKHRVFLNLTNGTRRTEPFDPNDIDGRYIGEKDTNLG